MTPFDAALDELLEAFDRQRLKRDGSYEAARSHLLALHAEARAMAIEECAKVCEDDSFDSEMRAYGKYFATAIRALLEKAPCPSGGSL